MGRAIKLFFIFIFFSIFAASLYFYVTSSPKINKGVVVDLGSTGSRITIFYWEDRTGLIQAPITKKTWKYKTTATSITLFPTVNEAVLSLEPLLQYAEKFIRKDFADSLDNTYLFVYGTSGLRTLDQNKAKELLDAIYSYVEQNFSYFNFPKESIGILTGKQEAKYDWFTAQELVRFVREAETDEFLDLQHETNSFGVLDMGGGSCEIAYNEDNSADAKLISEGFDGFGYNAAITAHQLYLLEQANSVPNSENTDFDLYSDPCLLSGSRVKAFPGINYTTPIGFKGYGDYKKCANSVKKVIDKISAGVDLSHIKAHKLQLQEAPFLAFSFFADVADFFGIRGKSSLANLQSRVKEFCSFSLKQAKAAHPDADSNFLVKNCFYGIYVHQLLVYKFGFSNDADNIYFHTRLYFSWDINWALGLVADYSQNMLENKK